MVVASERLHGRRHRVLGECERQQRIRPLFEWKLEFDLTLVPYSGDDSWVEGTLKKIKKCLDSDGYRTPPAIVTIVGAGNGRQGITFHTNTKNTPTGQPDEGYIGI